MGPSDQTARSDSESFRGAEEPVLQRFSLGGDFTLTDHHGEEFRLESRRGEVLLLFFGYASCPDVCPLTMSKLKRVYDILGEKGDGVLTVMVTVDSARDSPVKLGEYLGYFALPAVGLTGSQQQIEAVARQYGASFERSATESAAGYLIDHSTYLYLIDQAGELRYLFRYGDPPEVIAAGVRQLKD
jgi:protein SCO1/2